MSHFTVAVITKGKPTGEMIDKLMAPYQENNMGDCPKEYLKFNSTREDCIRKYNECTKTMYRDKNGNLYRYNEKQFEKPIKAEDREKYREWHSKGSEYFTYDYTGYTKVEIPHKDIWTTVDEYLKEYCDDEWDEEAQDYGYWENPNAKWDWYQIGGRYAGCVRVNKETAVDYGYGEKSWGYGNKNPYTEDGDIICVDSARVKDIIQRDEKEAERLKRKWELIVDNEEPQNNDEKIEKAIGFNAQYYIDLYGTKEKFIEIESQFHTYAVLTKDGKWHEAGAMGWWGISCADVDETRKFKEAYKQFVFDNAEDDDYITVVDCHI